MNVKLTNEDATEVIHKLGILCDSTELQEDYKLTQEQADTLYESIPWDGGTWTVPDFAVEAVKGEMQDHASVMRDMADDARAGGETGQSLRIHKQAKRFEEMFS